MIRLHLRAIDFKNTQFIGYFNNGCAIEKAAMRQFKLLRTSVNEDTKRLQFFLGKNTIVLTHDIYIGDHFSLDMEKAEESRFDNSIIRTIELNFIQS